MALETEALEALIQFCKEELSDTEGLYPFLAGDQLKALLAETTKLKLQVLDLQNKHLAYKNSSLMDRLGE